MLLIETVVLLGVFGIIANGIPLEKDSNRIIGGEEAPYGYAPHMAALAVGDQVLALLCGGSIITKKLILTAAHCIEAIILPNSEMNRSFHARVGSKYWNSGGTVVKFSTYHIHPQWDRLYIKFDVGLLVLEKELVLNEYVEVIASSFEFIGEKKSFVTGWGMAGPKIEDNIVHLAPIPDELQLLYVSTLSHERCQQVMSAATAGIWTPPIQMDVEICTLHSPGHGMCNGDSGSALVDATTREQIGIVSWGFNCAVGAPDVFVRMYGVKDFVLNITERYHPVTEYDVLNK